MSLLGGIVECSGAAVPRTDDKVARLTYRAQTSGAGKPADSISCIGTKMRSSAFTLLCAIGTTHTVTVTRTSTVAPGGTALVTGSVRLHALLTRSISRARSSAFALF